MSPKAGKLCCCCCCPWPLADGRREEEELFLLLLVEGYFGSSGLMVGEGSGVNGESEVAREEAGRLFEGRVVVRTRSEVVSLARLGLMGEGFFFFGAGESLSARCIVSWEGSN